MDKQDLKRKRINTGGSADNTTDAQATSDFRALPDSEKFEILFQKCDQLETVTSALQTATRNLEHAYKTIDNLSVQLAVIKEKADKSDMRIIDIEARGRRNNLVFHNIPERDGYEDEEQCAYALYKFMARMLDMSDAYIDSIHLQRVHRLGKPRSNNTRRPNKPRPIIACFCDFPVRQDILNRAKLLQGTNYSIQEDFPCEIRDARGDLWPEFRRAKNDNLRPKIVYPAKLVVNKEVIRDCFPTWGSWNRSKRHEQRDAGNTEHRRGTPMDGPMSDLVNATPFTPRAATNMPGTHHEPEVAPSDDGRPVVSHSSAAHVSQPPEGAAASTVTLQMLRSALTAEDVSRPTIVPDVSRPIPAVRNKKVSAVPPTVPSTSSQRHNLNFGSEIRDIINNHVQDTSVPPGFNDTAVTTQPRSTENSPSHNVTSQHDQCINSIDSFSLSETISRALTTVFEDR